ncbi:MAG: radical SAM protein [Bacteroidales bacterium]|nr:radical SAM protein [Bacteroidales bacterium]
MNKIAWITVNRQCNLRCSWCYVGFDGKAGPPSMDRLLLHELIDLCADGGTRKIVFIGGEPTVYPYLLEGIQHCRKRSLHTEITTNGVRLADPSFVDELVEAGLDSVMISLKGSDREGFKKTTGKDAFHAVVAALKTVSASILRLNVSAVLTTAFVNHLETITPTLAECGVKKIVFSFLKEFGEDDAAFLSENSPDIIFPLLYTKVLSSASTFAQLDWCIESCIPVFGWEELFDGFFKGRFHHSCQRAKNAPLSFDTAGRLLYCNALPRLYYGLYGTDFSDYEQLSRYLRQY